MKDSKELICKKCGSTLLVNGDKFCSQCGEEIAVNQICPKCNFAVKPGSNFCSRCGADLREKSKDTSEAPHTSSTTEKEQPEVSPSKASEESLTDSYNEPTNKCPYLEVQNTHNKDDIGKKFPLKGNKVVIGRIEDVDISFPQDECLSSKHSVLTQQDCGWVIEDCKSRNGTFLAVISPRVLADGDVIRVGETSLIFRLG